MYHGGPPARARPTNTLRTADRQRGRRAVAARLAALAARGGCCAAGWPSPTTASLARRDLPVARAGAPAGLRLRAGGAGSSVEGARNWALAGAGRRAAGGGRAALGLARPALYLPAVKLVFAAVGVATAWATAPARASGWAPGRSLSAAVGALWALAAPAIYFAPAGAERDRLRAAGDARARLGAARRRFPPRAGAGRLAAGSRGAAAAAERAVLRRRSSAWLARRRWRETAEAVVGAARLRVPLRAARPADLGRLVPLGAWYLALNLVQGRGALFGASAPATTSGCLWTLDALVAAVLVPAVVLGAIRAPALGGDGGALPRAPRCHPAQGAALHPPGAARGHGARGGGARGGWRSRADHAGPWRWRSSRPSGPPAASTSLTFGDLGPVRGPAARGERLRRLRRPSTGCSWRRASCPASAA